MQGNYKNPGDSIMKYIDPVHLRQVLTQYYNESVLQNKQEPEP